MYEDLIEFWVTEHVHAPAVPQMKRIAIFNFYTTIQEKKLALEVIIIKSLFALAFN